MEENEKVVDLQDFDFDKKEPAADSKDAASAASVAVEKKDEHKQQHDLLEKPKSAAADWAQSQQRLGGQSKAAQPHQRQQQKSSGGSSKDGKFSLKDFAINAYDRQYKKLLVIPAAVIIVAVVILLQSYSSTGSFFKKDISLSGGISVSAVTDFSDDVALENELSQRLPDSDVGVRRLTQLGKSVGVVVEANIESESDIDALLNFLSSRLDVNKGELTVQRVGATFGQSFFRQMIIGMLMAFVFMAIAVFVYFKIIAGKWLWLPGAFVVWTAFVDIVCTLAVVSFVGMHVSAAGLAAFLMLVGYSVDTDILLTVRALKGGELKLFDRIRSAVRTGVMMSLTAFCAVIAGYFFAESETIKQIMFILSAGMIFDIIHTWITNAGLLRWYLEKQGMA